MGAKFTNRDLKDSNLIYGKGATRWELNLGEGS